MYKSLHRNISMNKFVKSRVLREMSFEHFFRALYNAEDIRNIRRGKITLL